MCVYICAYVCVYIHVSVRMRGGRVTSTSLRKSPLFTHLHVGCDKTQSDTCTPTGKLLVEQVTSAIRFS